MHFTEIAKFNSTVDDLKIDKNNNVYVKSDSKIYKCLAGQMNFTEIIGIAGHINVWAVDDKSGDLYASSKDDDILYKCLAGQTVFKQLIEFKSTSWRDSNIGDLTIDKSGNIFVRARAENGPWRLFKCETGQTVFEQMLLPIGVSCDNISLIVGNNDTLYINFRGTLYKSEKFVNLLNKVGN